MALALALTWKTYLALPHLWQSRRQNESEHVVVKDVIVIDIGINNIGIDDKIGINDKMEVETPQKDHKNNDDDDDDDQVQVISPPQAEREARRKRRRRLYKMLNKPGTVPSFLALLTQTEEQLEEVSDDESIPPPVVVIDVDAYLGLKKIFPDGAFSGYDMNMLSPVPTGTPSSSSIFGSNQCQYQYQSSNFKYYSW
jgi:hypothetical protein